jgi:glycolate oxidase FAD binding subunit
MTLVRAGSAAAGGVALAAVRDALRAIAAEGRIALPRGAGTKDALSTPDAGSRALDVAALDGIVEYAPSEFTVTALAGTPVAAIAAALADHGQYLPFDPILLDAGATLGGTIAAGVSGSGRVRYGGIRDFVLGVRFLDGDGILVRGGGKVVKNAAGFDLPKLMVGSLGSLGVLVEVTLKVFPAPRATATGRVELEGLDGAIAGLRRVLAGPCEVDALDLEPPASLWVRVAGREQALAARLDRALAIAAGFDVPGGGVRQGSGDAMRGAGDAGVRRLAEDEAERHWRAARELEWVPPASRVVKVPLQPGRVADLDRALAERAGRAATTRYTGGGQQALVAWPDGVALDVLDATLDELGLSGLVLRGAAPRRRLGRRPGEAALERARRALDPHRRFRDP